MASVSSNVLTVPDFHRPIVYLTHDPSRPPSSQSLRRSMSEESLNKVTIPISREVPYFVSHMPPSPAKTPTNRSSENLQLDTTAMAPPADRIVPLHDVNVSITNLHQTVVSNREDDSPTASKNEVNDYIQQTADILSETVKDFQELSRLDISEKSTVEQLVAANLRLLRTLKDRHAALDKVEHEVRTERNRSGPYTSINRSIYFDTPGETPPQASRITFKESVRRNSDDMDGMSTISVEWTDRKEERLKELQRLLKSANRAWSAEQNNYLEELEQLQEERRKHKKKVKTEQRQTDKMVKMERSLSMSNERERRVSTSRERVSPYCNEIDLVCISNRANIDAWILLGLVCRHQTPSLARI
ncbi:hypothetical protein TWF173_008020 [Orbilia oligospora]|uniref:Uncharacterized protein n=1 Tax=Orbilia oligospora TaxID=2813651 RepID=A0A7C8REW7_ORBOL|nr:hypothetical protein TWF970_002997 [Orbilia oligospora]KAF3280252.1 hypothetical protein TWF970_002997 [Orbilia oligospora]KAF3311745.1 hypothetical protein TWF173_008020 [Orbilia oligospora]KAF3311746.1 hypothetical protein TWF173_008020 [Orbilia oligospora]